MVTCYPASPRQWAYTVAVFLTGGCMFGVGLHLSYENIAPQQARIRARNQMVLEHYRKKKGM